MSSDRELQQQHLQQLKGSALSDEVIEARGYWTATRRTELASLGFQDYQCRVPALVLPQWSLTGEQAGYLIRPDNPRVRDEKPIKYEAQAGVRPVLDVHPLALEWIKDPARPLIITEGIKKADAAVSQGLPAIGLLGVYGWRGRNEHDGTAVLPDWEYVPLKNRQVRLAFDSDMSTNPNVATALHRLAAFLRSRGATVTVIYLPVGPEGAKTGLDDFFVRGGTVEELLALEGDAESDERSLQAAETGESASPYQWTDEGLFVTSLDRQGRPVRSRLATFSAFIDKEVVIDPEESAERTYVVHGKVDGKESVIEVPADEFNRMEWVSRFGSRAIIEPGFAVKDRVRAAIQHFSHATVTNVYRSLGWFRLAGVPYFRHVNGAIGPDGNRTDVIVQPAPELRPYCLPEPPNEQELRESFAAVWRLRTVYDPATFWRLFALVVAAPLGDLLKLDFVAWLYGTTGRMKSTSAALFSSFFGKFDRRTFPGNFRSTANALESRGHQAKNVLFVVDDYVPPVDKWDRQNLEKLAVAIIRQVGDSQGRARLTRDLRDRPQKPYRGCVLVTSEVLPPGGPSTQARCFLVPWDQAAINVEALTEADPADFVHYQKFMASFIQYLAVNYEGIGDLLSERVRELRSENSSSHARLGEVQAKLTAALEVFGVFAVDRGLLTHAQQDLNLAEVSEALTSSTLATSVRERDERPANRLLEALKVLFAQKLAYVTGAHRYEPLNAGRWGWIEREEADPESDQSSTRTTPAPGATKIGEINATTLHLFADRAAKLVADQLRITLPSVEDLGAGLKAEGLLTGHDKGRHQKSVRIGGQNVRVLAISLRAFPDRDGQEEPEDSLAVSPEESL